MALPHLRKSTNASIINISSFGRLGYPLRTPYAASKWAVIGFTKSLSVELGKAGIRVNSILPGLVEGERLRNVLENKARAKSIPVQEAEAEFVSYVAMKKTVTPQEIADAILFLCSLRGRTISGQALSICGDVQMLIETASVVLVDRSTKCASECESKGDDDHISKWTVPRRRGAAAGLAL
jgi:NAD(P)-dependent dehydrogenase (short-subunit alcohol dehydrogenase family)